MSSVGYLREFVNERLTAAAEEIFRVFEKTIVEYEEEIHRQRRLLDIVCKPEIQLHRIDVQHLLAVKEEFPPEQQEWSSSVDKDEPEHPHIIEKLRISQEGEQLQGLEEADITKFPITLVPVKSEDDEERPQFSQINQRQTEQMKAEADGEDCGGPEPAMKSDPDPHLQPDTDDEPGDSSEPETDNSEDWKETREPQSGLNSTKNKKVPVSDIRFGAGENPFIYSECGKRFGRKTSLKRHITHAGEKQFSCPVCKKGFTRNGTLKTHMRIHTGEKPFSCSVCKKAFAVSGRLVTHMRIHTGEKPFSCSVCKKAFAESGSLVSHMRIHTGEKPFSCSVCKKDFTERGSLVTHMRIHTGEKPFSCSVCKKAFTVSGSLVKHMRIHTGEKPFSCSVTADFHQLRNGSSACHLRAPPSSIPTGSGFVAERLRP